MDNPLLATALFQMHKNTQFRKIETLSAIITTNHDGLLQRAAHTAYGGINIGFRFSSAEYRPWRIVPMILQIHGSLTWAFSTPLQVTALGTASEYSSDTTWIPPTVSKEAKAYPFNKLMGLAYEALSKRCDVLRIIGSSLTQNDWNILGLIFNAQRHREYLGEAAFRIELIMPQRIGKRLEFDCSFLANLSPIGSLTDGDFAEYKDLGDTDNPTQDSNLSNPFFFWLREKVHHHVRSNDFGPDELPSAMRDVLGDRQ